MVSLTAVLFSISFCFSFDSAQAHAPSHYLQTSAVISDPNDDNAAKLQCWRFKQPFLTYPTIGSFVQLADVSNISYVVLPPGSSEGIHHPPHPMYVYSNPLFGTLSHMVNRIFVLLSGIAHVTLPSDPDDPGLWIQEGVNPLIVAVDTEGPGHWTDYPGNTETAALQLPFKNGKVPEYEVVSEGPCKNEKQWTESQGDGFVNGDEQTVLKT